MKPRPWYISLTAILNDDTKATTKLEKVLSEMDISSIYPQHHIEVNSIARHLTILALLRINTLPSSFTNYCEFSRCLFSSLITDDHVLKLITNYFGFGLSLDAYELRIFDSGTVIQFRGNQELASFREVAKVALLKPVTKLVNSFPEGTTESLIDDPVKNVGNHAFGSIARSPTLSEIHIERYRKTLKREVNFNFRYIHLLVSDDALTNPRIINTDDIIIKSE